ncbi:hypothetical protein [Candidatus Nitrospira bockiana]
MKTYLCACLLVLVALVPVSLLAQTSSAGLTLPSAYPTVVPDGGEWFFYSAGPDKQNLWGAFGSKDECTYQRTWAARATGVTTTEQMDLKFSPCFKAANALSNVRVSGIPESTVTIQTPTAPFKFGQ